MRESVRTIALLASGLAAAGGTAHAVDTAWVRLYGGCTTSCLNRATEIAVDSSGVVFVCGGGERDWPTHSDMLIAAYGEDGTFIDAKAIGGIALSRVDEVAQACALDGAGNAYLVGSTYHDLGLRSFDVTWGKYTLIDDTLHKIFANKTGWNGDDLAYDIAVGPDQGIYICGADGRDTLGRGLSAFLVTCIDPATGYLNWSRSLILDTLAASRPEYDFHPSFYEEWQYLENCATCLGFTPDGCVVAAGFGWSSCLDYEMWVVKLDATGDVIWQTVYHDTTSALDDVVFDMAIAADGTIYVAGLTENDTTGYNFAVVRLNDSGVVTGTYLYGVAYDAFATRLALDDRDPPSVYATGVYDDDFLMSQVMTQKLSADLIPLWGERGAVFGGMEDDYGYDVKYRDGRVFVTGSLAGDLFVHCYSDSSTPGGQSLWTFTYDSPDGLEDIGTCLCVLDTDHIFVGGECDRADDTTSDWTNMLVARLRCQGSGTREIIRNSGIRGSRASNPVCAVARVPWQSSRGGPVPVTVYDAVGRPARRLTPVTNGKGWIDVDLVGLSAGVYIIQLGGADTGSSATYRVVAVP